MTLTLRATLLCPLLSGCVATALYGSPRPLAPEQVQTTLLLETVANGGALAKPGVEQVGAAPFPGPGLEMRIGVTRGVDIGGRISAASGFATDCKIALVEEPRLALSLDPALAAAPYATAGGAGGLQGSLRLLGGWRFDPNFELIAHATGGVLYNSDSQAALATVGTWGGGVSLLMHITRSFALQPSMTSLWRNDRAVWAPELAFGLGLVFGEGS